MNRQDRRLLNKCYKSFQRSLTINQSKILTALSNLEIDIATDEEIKFLLERGIIEKKK